MDARGFYPAHGCRRCGNPLQGEGSGRPAELYAGTYTGLCYPCSNGPAYIKSTEYLDGARYISYPPHCPSWRRDREVELSYPDCPDCGGSGRHYVSRDMSQGGSYYRYCETCHKRYYAHPLRKEWEDAYTAEWDAIIAAGYAEQKTLLKARGARWKGTKQKPLTEDERAINQAIIEEIGPIYSAKLRKCQERRAMVLLNHRRAVILP